MMIDDQVSTNHSGVLKKGETKINNQLWLLREWSSVVVVVVIGFQLQESCVVKEEQQA